MMVALGLAILGILALSLSGVMYLVVSERVTTIETHAKVCRVSNVSFAVGIASLMIATTVFVAMLPKGLY